MPERTHIGIRIDSALLADLDRWAKKQPIVPTRTAVIEGLIRAHLAEHGRTTTCAYCGAIVPADEPIPELDDWDGWAETADRHSIGCEWVETRAHRASPRDAMRIEVCEDPEGGYFARAHQRDGQERDIPLDADLVDDEAYIRAEVGADALVRQVWPTCAVEKV